MYWVMNTAGPLLCKRSHKAARRIAAAWGPMVTGPNIV